MKFQKIEWTDDVIEEFWRYWSERPSTYFSEAFGNTIVRFAKSKLGPLGIVLDYGAGSGGLLAALSGEKIKCYGQEFGQSAVARLVERFGGDESVVGIFETQDTSKFEKSFDTVFLIETIEHMPDRHLDPSIARIVAMLKPGGWLFVSTPNDENLAAAEVYCPVSKIAFHPMQHLRSWDKNTLITFLNKFGFTDIDCLETDLQALPIHSKSVAIKRALKRILYRSYKDPHLVAFARKPKN